MRLPTILPMERTVKQPISRGALITPPTLRSGRLLIICERAVSRTQEAVELFAELEKFVSIVLVRYAGAELLNAFTEGGVHARAVLQRRGSGVCSMSNAGANSIEGAGGVRAGRH